MPRELLQKFSYQNGCGKNLETKRAVAKILEPKGLR